MEDSRAPSRSWIWMLAMPALAFAMPCETHRPEAPETECVVDDDCGLVPATLNCCGECPPAPPFEAVPRSELDAMLIELETTCAERSIGCASVPACEPVPAGCHASAACTAGRCVVVEDGCGPLVSVAIGG
jgi:hypothetical protein